MAYTPELSDYHSGTLRRIAWALGKPMTQAINMIFDNVDRFIDPAKVCDKCKDKTICESCYFNTGTRISPVPVDPLLPELQTTTKIERTNDMRVNQVSVLVSKKIGKNFCSWSLSYGATAELEDEDHYPEIISQLDTELRGMISTALPHQNGNGHEVKPAPNGNGNNKQT